MRRLALVLGLLGSLIGPDATRQASGQTSVPECLAPSPRPFQANLPLPGDSVGGSEVRDYPALYISAGGELCQSFHPTGPPGEEWQAAADRAPSPGKAALLSAILPGAGQWYMGQQRWPAYLAAEGWAWLQFLDWRREGHHLQKEYKDLAWLVARRVSTGTRTEAGWEYYEALTRFQTSGAYDSDPITPGIQPETDPSTFNGSIWALAQQIYIPEDSENPVEVGSEPYEQASAYYVSRAYSPRLAWNWGTNTLHREEYTALIRESDEALRKSTGMIGIILANHLLSAVDALVSGRLGIAGEVDPSVRVMLLPGPFNTREVALRVRLANPFAHGY